MLRPRPWLRIAGISIVAIAVVAALQRSGAAPSGARSAARSAATSSEPGGATASIAKGETLWGQFCASCHEAQSGTRQALGPVLISREYLDFATDQRLDSIITGGIAATTMLGWGKGSAGMLDEVQVRSLIAFMRSLQRTAPSDPGWKTGRKVAIP